MRNSYRLVLVICLTLSLARMVSGTILPTWNDERAYRPIPAGFVHGMNSSPEAWGFQIDQRTEEVLGYTIPGTAYGLFQYFDNYLDKNPVTNEPLPYLEPFNYQYNTFDSIKWNAYEGYVDESGNVHNGEQYTDGRISEEAARPTLRVYQEGGSISNVSGSPVTIGGILKKYTDPQTGTLPKTNLVAHSLGGVVSRYYVNKTQGANVKQLTTLGTPHKGAAVAVVIPPSLTDPVTDPFKWSIIWRVILFRLFDNLDVNRRPEMIYELYPTSQFIANLNSSIPAISRYYCIGGVIGIASLFHIYTDTDGFIELTSALAAKEGLPLTAPADYQPPSIFPNYKGKILFPSWWDIISKETNHLALPEKWEEILKAIDDTKPVIELTEVKDIQNRVLWRTGQYPDYFDVSQDGRIKVHGLCRKEYLPADTYINIGFRKAGRTEIQWVKDGGLTLLQDEAQEWLLQPSDSWRANDSESPVAEFEVEVNFPLQEITHSIVVEARNPGGIKSEPVEVSEKTWYMYGVGQVGEAKLWCMDGPTSFADGMSAIVSEFSLVDEQGQNISSRPLDIATSGNTVWVSFDDKKIYAYDRITMKPSQLPTGRYYYTTTGTPDGLYYDGSLQYCSSIDNKLYRINISDGTKTGLGVVSRRLALDGVATDSLSVNYTTQEYTGYSPRGISARYLCSSKISKRDGQNFIQTLPTNTPVWMNEQESPASSLGIVEVADNTVPEGHVVYLSATDGNIYKVRFEDKIAISRLTWPNIPFYKYWLVPDLVNLGTRYVSFYPTGMGYGLVAYPGVYEAGGTIAGTSSEMGDVNKMQIGHLIFRLYGTFTPPSNFIKAVAVSEGIFTNYRMELVRDEWYEWDAWREFCNRYSQSGATISTCESLQGSTDEQFNTPLIAHLWTQPYNATLACVNTINSTVTVVDVTNTMPRTDFTYTIRYDNEGQDLSVNSWKFFPSASMGDIAWGRVSTSVRNINLSFLTNNGSLETQDQFSMASGVAEGIAIGPRVNIRIEPQTLSLRVGQTGQLRVNGKGPYTWGSSDDTVAVIEEISGATGTVKAVSVGTGTITVQDSLGNKAKVTVNVSAS